MRQAQVNIARNLGREAFGALFPDVPFPAEAAPPGAAPPAPAPADPAARLAQPPTAAQAQVNAATAPPATPGPVGAAAGPAPSTSAAGARLSPPAPAAAPGAAATPGDNPLARFSLPSLTVPATGEAGLYHRPPTFAYPPPSTAPGVAAPYADIAYGAYPHFAGTQAYAPSPVGAAGERRAGMNVEERVEFLRKRWGGAAGAPGPSTSAEGATGSSAPGIEATSEDGEAGEPAKVDKGKGKAVEPASAVEGDGAAKQDDDDAALSPRAAALRAAERRAGKPSSALGPLVAAAGASASSSAQADSSDLSGPAVDLDGSPSSSAGAAGNVPPPVPRLIPLFDPSNPSPSLADYPSLLPLSSDISSLDARPLLPAMAQLSEAEQLARRGVEERLRLLVGFQERIEGLVGEMRAALDSAPLDGRARATAEKAAQPEREKEGLAFGEARASQEGERKE